MSKTLFENMTENLKHLSQEMAGMEEFRDNTKDVDELVESINSPLLIMVMGEFSTGKSTFINALVGETIAKVDAKPTTAVITKLTYGAQDRITVHYQDGSAKEYGREEFERLTAEADVDANKLHESMDYVERTLPIDILKSMSIIDSPGLNSIKQVHEDMTRHFMDKADTVLWMFDANKPGSQTEIDALKRLNPRLTPLVLVNKIDGIDEEEGDSVEGILGEVERRLKNNKLEAQGYIGISAKWAFQGKQENKEKMVKASNIGAFYNAMEETVLPGREQYKRNSLLDGLVKMIYGVGSHLQELREKNEARKDKDYATYIEMETELATVWDELENIADIMLTDIEQNQPEGRKRLNAAMKSFYGMLHWLGIFVEKDDEAARKYLEEAAVRGDEAAQRVLVDWLLSKGEEEAAGYWAEKIGLKITSKRLPMTPIEMLKKGESLFEEGNYTEALSWFKKAEADGNTEVMYRIGMSYHKGKGVTQNYDMAVEWYVKAANHGNGDAMRNLGDMYAEGQGVKQNEDTAIYWYQKAIKVGNIEAKENLKRLNDDKKRTQRESSDGNGLPMIPADMLKRAETNGDTDAMYQIGTLYYNGIDVAQNYDMAIEWYVKAANKGNRDAMSILGEIYDEGQVVDKNLDAASYWYKRRVSKTSKSALKPT